MDMTKLCQTEGCKINRVTKHYCSKHYAQFKRKGFTTIETRLSPNPYNVKGVSTYIGLRGQYGEVIGYAIIDSEDSKKTKGIKWSRRIDGYIHGIKDKKRYYLHRLVTDCPKGNVINHRNHNKLDNRKINLDICDQWQNAAYRRKTRGKHIYKGVSYNDDCLKKWVAIINFRGNKIRVGKADTMQEAAYIYDQLAMQLLGEYAFTNFDW